MTHLQCHWTGTLTPRALTGRHEDDCDDERCRGCLRCPRFHCIACGIEHVDERTCPGCVGEVRDQLADVLTMFVALPAHAVHGGNDSKLEAARPIPGGEAMVMAGPGAPKGYLEVGDHQTTEQLLVSWEEDWRSVRGTRREDLASIGTAAAYLGEHLSWAAQHHDAFDAFAAEIRAHRAHLEDVLHDGERVETGAPCEKCRKPMERFYASLEHNDRWWCPRCKVSLDPAEYVEAVAREARRHSSWLTARDMQAEHRVPVGTLQGWAAKGKVAKRRDWHLARTVYSVRDTLRQRDMRDTPDAA